MLLERKGYTVTGFQDGEPLISGEFETPDLFIIDKQLPGVDGIELCRMLKDGASTGGIPVLILSASPQAGTIANAAGADSFLEKAVYDAGFAGGRGRPPGMSRGCHAFEGAGLKARAFR